MQQNEIILQTAVFNPKVKTYIFLVVLFTLLVSIIGWILIPFWLLGLGTWLSGKFFKTLSCQLTSKNLKFSKGLILHIEKTIPLDNIQDLSFYGGPLLKYLGLTLIKIETAGGGGHSTNNMMTLPGIEGAVEFKQHILAQREKIIKEKFQPSGVSAPVTTSSSTEDLLRDIKYELIEIKNALKK